MTLLASIMDKLEALHRQAVCRALGLVEELLVPAGPVPRSIIQRLVKRAQRHGAWRYFSAELRALLLAASRAPLRAYQSPVLLALVRQAWLLVEMITLRGRAVVAAILYLAARGVAELAKALRRGISHLLVIGLQVLGTPWADALLRAEPLPWKQCRKEGNELGQG